MELVYGKPKIIDAHKLHRPLRNSMGQSLSIGTTEMLFTGYIYVKLFQSRIIIKVLLMSHGAEGGMCI